MRIRSMESDAGARGGQIPGAAQQAWPRQPVRYSYACRYRLGALDNYYQTERNRLVMPAPITDRQPRNPRVHKPTVRREGDPIDAPNCELPSREALTVRLEAQRAELLRVMERVNRAHNMLEGHIVSEQRVLESLNDAKQSLATAYPMLERIAEALHVDKILKEQS